MILLYCPECRETRDVERSVAVTCPCRSSSAKLNYDGSIKINGRAVILHIFEKRLDQAIMELETGPSAGISGMVLREGNGMIEIEKV